jgi:hypothetical protein
VEELVPTATFATLLGIGKSALSDLAARGIVKRGTYLVEESDSGQYAHLRDMAAGRGGEAGASASQSAGVLLKEASRLSFRLRSEVKALCR